MSHLRVRGFILAFLFFSLAASSVHPPPWNAVDETYSFDDFVRQFNVMYADATEFEHRRIIFEENLKRIVSHNIGRQGKGHFLTVNEFADRLPEELPKGYVKGIRPPLIASSTVATAEGMIVDLDTPVSLLPTAVDWRTKGVTTPIKAQGHCGSCWAFAATAALESHIALQTGALFTLSVQEFVSCASNPLHCGGNGGCAGATANVAFDYVKQHGIVQEWNFGYQSYNGLSIECSLEDDNGATVESEGSFLRGNDGLKASYLKEAVATIAGYATLERNSYTALMNAVAKLGPVTVSVACSPWHLYGGGVFYTPFTNSTLTTDINHLVVLEGYGTDEETGEDYWLIRNSWGRLWGEDGYIRLKRVDPSTLDDPDSDCGLDVTPADGNACTKDKDGQDITPPPEKICGNSGLLTTCSVPLGGFLIDRMKSVD